MQNNKLNKLILAYDIYIKNDDVLNNANFIADANIKVFAQTNRSNLNKIVNAIVSKKFEEAKNIRESIRLPNEQTNIVKEVIDYYKNNSDITYETNETQEKEQQNIAAKLTEILSKLSENKSPDYFEDLSNRITKTQEEYQGHIDTKLAEVLSIISEDKLLTLLTEISKKLELQPPESSTISQDKMELFKEISNKLDEIFTKKEKAIDVKYTQVTDSINDNLQGIKLTTNQAKSVVDSSLQSASNIINIATKQLVSLNEQLYTNVPEIIKKTSGQYSVKMKEDALQIIKESEQKNDNQLSKLTKIFLNAAVGGLILIFISIYISANYASTKTITTLLQNYKKN